MVRLDAPAGTRDDEETLSALLAEVAALRAENARLRGPDPGATASAAEPWRTYRAPDGLLRAIAGQALDALAAARCSIWLLDAATGRLRVAAWAGLTEAEEEAICALSLPAEALALAGAGRASPAATVVTGRAARETLPADLAAGFDPRTCLVVPIDGPGGPPGAICLDQRAAPREWTAEDRRVAGALAGQASLAIETTRRYAEERRRAERAEAIREVVRELTAEFDLDRRLAVLQEQVKRITGLATCWVAVRDPANNRMNLRNSSESEQPVATWSWADFAGARGSRTMLWALLDGRVPILTDDYAAECARRGLEPQGPLATRPGRAWLGVPLLVGDEVIGALAVWRWDGPIPAEAVALLTGLAGQIASALENARLYAEADRQRREEVAFNAIAQDLAVALDSDLVLRHIVDHARAFLGGRLASIFLYDASRDLLYRAALSGADGARLGAVALRPGEGMIGKVWRDGAAMIVGDYLTDQRLARTPALERNAAAAQTSSSVGVPIALGDERLGVLAVSGSDPDQFTTHDATLLARLAAQAALAVRNTRLYAAERERAARAEVLREVGRALSAELDLDRFLDTTWRQLTRIVDAAGCWLALWDEPTRSARYCLYVADGERHPEQESAIPPGTTLGWMVLEERATIRVADHAAECRRRGLIPRGAVPPRPDNAWLGIPLLAGGQLVGALAIWQYGAPFGDDATTTLETLAGQIASALANARLYREAERRRHEEAIFSAVAQDLAAPLGGDTVLERIAGHARALFGGNSAWIMRFDPGTGLLNRAARSDAGGRQVPAVAIRPGEGIAGHVWQSWRPFLTTDYQADARFVHLAALDELQAETGVQPIFGVPIALGDERLGVLIVDTAPGYQFDPRHEGLLVRLADQAALGIQNARLYAEARERADRLEVLNEAGRELSAEIDFDRFLALIWRQLNRITALDGCWVALWHEGSGELEICLYVDRGRRHREWEKALAPGSGEGLAWAILQERAPLRVDDYLAECHRRGLRPAGTWPDRPATPWLGLPLVVGGRTIGVMAVWRLEGGFGDEELAPLGTLAGQIAATLENARLYREARTLASTDPLTGLLNHRHVQERLDQELARAARHGLSLAVVMLDLNNFKLFNDTYGHPAGDEVLRTVAAALRAEGRAEDMPGRYGGDEFLLVLPETGSDGALALVERVQERLRRTVVGGLAREGAGPEEPGIPLQLSAGIALYPGDGVHRHELIALADGALYASKRSGGRPTTVAPRPNWAVDGLTIGSHAGFDVVEGLVLAVDAKDHYTVAHSQVVADTAVMLAEALGLPDRTLAILRAAGLLHDVGKISIPDRVLRKPAPLNDEEWQVMRQHVEFSELIIRGVPGLSEILEPVMHHHERWDGEGYPRALAGEAVPILGRIMIVADAYSAMVLDRPYRRGLTVEQAVAELRAGAGSQFDPALVAVLCDTIEREKLHAIVSLALAS